MDAKEAIRAAKGYVADLFADEKIVNLGLEEVEYNDSNNTWNITLGFSRPWDVRGNTLMALTTGSAPGRSYHVVQIREDGTMVYVKRSELAAG